MEPSYGRWHDFPATNKQLARIVLTAARALHAARVPPPVIRYLHDDWVVEMRWNARAALFFTHSWDAFSRRNEAIVSVPLEDDEPVVRTGQLFYALDAPFVEAVCTYAKEMLHA